MRNTGVSLTRQFTAPEMLPWRCFNRLKQFRRIATRYEKNAENYLAMLTLASIQLWL